MMEMKRKAFNFQAFLEFLCYFCFSAVLFYLLSSQRYLYYVTPRTGPYLVFTAGIMLLWALTCLGRVFKPQYRIRTVHCLVLALPMLLILLPHTPLGSSDLVGTFGTDTAFIGQGTQSTSPGGGAAAAPNGQSASSQGNFSETLPGLDRENQKIIIENQYFYQWTRELYDHMDLYEGYQVTVTGFVFKGYERLEPTQFFASRLLMTCCVADLAPIGLFCEYELAPQLSADSWVTVEGILYPGKHGEYNEPRITVTKVTSTEERPGYVYSN